MVKERDGRRPPYNQLITMDRNEARTLAARHVREGEARPEVFSPVILDEATEEGPWGWVFFYNTADYARTHDSIFALAGNAPIVVTRDGRLFETGTARPLSEYLTQIESAIGVSPSKP